jgi:hypothetical protein
MSIAEEILVSIAIATLVVESSKIAAALMWLMMP